MRNIKDLVISLLPFGLKSDDWMTYETKRITEFLETPMTTEAQSRKLSWEFNQAWNQVTFPANGLLDILTPDELTTQYNQWQAPSQGVPLTVGHLQQSWQSIRDQSGQQRQYGQAAIHNIGDFASVSNAHHGSTNLAPASGTSSGYSRVADERVYVPINSQYTVQSDLHVPDTAMYFLTNAGIPQRVPISNSSVDVNTITALDGTTWIAPRSR